MRDRTLQGEAEGDSETGAELETETEFADESAELTASVADSASDSFEDLTAAGYDEAVEAGVPFSAEPEILAQDSADPVALTEVEAASEDEIALQEAGRDLRPDTIVPAPDISAAEVAAIENLESLDEFMAEEDASAEASGDVQTSAPAVLEDAASSESTDEEKQDASPDAAN
jgi:hypothetical protein